jgi:hypothetical protein
VLLLLLLLLAAATRENRISMTSNAINIRISISGGRLQVDSVHPEVAGYSAGSCVADHTGSMHGSRSPYADAQISSLKQQLKQAQQQLQQLTGNSALHPAFIGTWERFDKVFKMDITSTQATTYRVGQIFYMEYLPEEVDTIERITPYGFAAKRGGDILGEGTPKTEHAMFTLLPSLDQLVKVNHSSSSPISADWPVLGAKGLALEAELWLKV